MMSEAGFGKDQNMFACWGEMECIGERCLCMYWLRWGWIVIGQPYNRELIKFKTLLFRFYFLKGNYIM